MCLGIPGKVLTIKKQPDKLLMGQVRFGGIEKEICLQYTPDVKIGEYVVVHAGFAISVINKRDADLMFKTMKNNLR